MLITLKIIMLMCIHNVSPIQLLTNSWEEAIQEMRKCLSGLSLLPR
jgi:hypothetical protein